MIHADTQLNGFNGGSQNMDLSYHVQTSTFCCTVITIDQRTLRHAKCDTGLQRHVALINHLCRTKNDFLIEFAHNIWYFLTVFEF